MDINKFYDTHTDHMGEHADHINKRNDSLNGNELNLGFLSKNAMDNLDSNSGTDGQKDKGKKKAIPLELTAHGTTPSGKPRLFVCQVCTRAFARLEHLRRHERSHTKEKPFGCGVCQRKFSRRDLLLRHAQKLHAGCADAITRLRRKSVKREDSLLSALESGAGAVTELSLTPSGSAAISRSASLPINSINPQSNQNHIQFNVNLFGSNNSVNSHLQHLQNYSKRRSNSEISRQLLTKKYRGASFSAQSGSNYSVNIPEFNDLYTGTENVEFSTPQLLPSGNYDDSWLSGLSTIPGMQNENARNNLSKLRAAHSPSNGPQRKKFDLNNLLYIMPTATMNSNDLLKSEVEGYSFYDIPESMNTKLDTEFKSNSILTPIKQEYDDHPTISSLNDHNTGGSHEEGFFDADLNFINDIGDLTNEIGNSKFVPNGYSFYGDSLTTELTPYSPNYLNQTQLLNIETNNLNNLNIGISAQHAANGDNYSKISLFTPNLRTLIVKSLNKYPVNGSINPIIPSNDSLENYLRVFKLKFLNHFPFIHPSRLNEADIMLMTSSEDLNNESSRVCLPLLISAIGALLSNNKTDLEHLYEASRRTVHIYLESRKNSKKKTNNPLWLIQSLTLSVVYGLFSDNENNVFIVIRQLNALNSLVKTSIRDKKSTIFFIIPQTANSSKQEEEYNNIINYQSQIRIIFMIYRLTNFLYMFYNIPLTLSVNDLNNLQIPTKVDELIWSLANWSEYISQIDSINEARFSNTNVINGKRNFKELLLKISKNSNNSLLNIPDLCNLSLFGYNVLVHGIFEINQFNANLNILNILDNLTKLFGSSTESFNKLMNKTALKSRLNSADYELIDYSIISNIVKISYLVDYKLLKQQSWLKNYDELIKYYKTVVDSIKINEFSKIDKVLDYAFTIMKFLVIKFENGPEDISMVSSPDLALNKATSDNLSELSEEDTEDYEKLIGIKFVEVLNNDPNLILTQSLFQLFSILSAVLVSLLKYPKNGTNDKITVKFREFLKFCKFIQINFNLPVIFETPACISLDNNLVYTDVYYLLNIGELLLNHCYQHVMKFAIYEKLSINLYQIRKFLSDNEMKQLTS